MNGLGKASLTVAAALVLASAGTVYAFAGWNSAVEPTSLTLRTAAMPAGNAPSVAKTAKRADITWVGNRLLPGVKVQSYIVTRFGAGKPVVVCDRVTTTSCKDKSVPSGTWTWRVQPVFETWIGRESADSVALTFTGPPPPDDLISATPAAPNPPVPSPAVTSSPASGPTSVRTSPPPAETGAPPADAPEPADAPPPTTTGSGAAVPASPVGTAYEPADVPDRGATRTN